MAIMRITEYARYRKVSHASVQEALKRGRILVHHQERRGKKKIIFLDREVCDTGWVQNTDAGHKRRPTQGEVRTAKRQVTPKRAPSSPGGTATQGGGKFLDAHTRREEFAAGLAELEFKKASGELVEASKIKIAWANIAQNIQQNMMSIPSRLSALIVGEYRTQLSLLVEKVAAGVSATKEDLTKWIDTVCDEKIVSDLLMAEIKKILTALSERQSWGSEDSSKTPSAATAGSTPAAAMTSPVLAASAGSGPPAVESPTQGVQYA